MGATLFATVGALHVGGGAQPMMRPAHVAPGDGLLSLGHRHGGTAPLLSRIGRAGAGCARSAGRMAGKTGRGVNPKRVSDSSGEMRALARGGARVRTGAWDGDGARPDAAAAPRWSTRCCGRRAGGAVVLTVCARFRCSARSTLAIIRARRMRLLVRRMSAFTALRRSKAAFDQAPCFIRFLLPG